MSHKRKKIIWSMAIIIMIIGLVVGYGKYQNYVGKGYKAELSFDEMIKETTKGNRDAVISVGYIKDGKMEYAVYGQNGKFLPKENHIYEIASLTKTFTTGLLWKSIGEGRISIEDNIDKYLPLVDKEYYPTIEGLVTHQSGYKCDYYNEQMRKNIKEGRNSFYGIPTKSLLTVAEEENLEDKDYVFEYSNFGISILGALLGQVYQKPYEELLANYIQEDLGLKNTKVAYGKGDLGGYWEWKEGDGYIPAAALVSTIEDMLQYAKLHLEGNEKSLEASHEMLADLSYMSGAAGDLLRIDGMASGWMLDNSHKIIWHSGMSDSYNCYIGIDKENQIAVVVLSNLPGGQGVSAGLMGARLLIDLQESR